MEKVIIIDNEEYDVLITEYPETDAKPRRYEIKVEGGISINDYDAYGDNLLYEWIFPSTSYDEAEKEFVRRVKAEREGMPYPYD